MPPLYLLIKPASSYCNMNCKYCFYDDVSNNRLQKSYGIMNQETAKNIIVKALSFSKKECSFSFQGGEPTLALLDFYKMFIDLVNSNNINNKKINYSIQTNGYDISKEFIEFFKENNFLVGISLDGNKDIHDSYRLSSDNKGTFSKVTRTIQLLDNYKVNYNIVSVTTSKLAKNITSVYNSYKKNNFLFQQYIPCLDPINTARGCNDYSLDDKTYGEFLVNLFNLWYNDFIKGNYISIRYFDNLISIIKTGQPENCGMFGCCMIQNIVESNGDVYPCDFYCFDEYKIGNLNINSFEDIYDNRDKINFIKDSKVISEECKKCEWYFLCRGGCRRDREIFGQEIALNCYCNSYKYFFNNTFERLKYIATIA